MMLFWVEVLVQSVLNSGYAPQKRMCTVIFQNIILALQGIS